MSKQEYSYDYFRNFPNNDGFFGQYGGIINVGPLEEEMKKIAKAYRQISQSADFIRELRDIREHFQGRPTPIYYCKRLSEKIGGARIYLKREDLNHTGAHKLNHCMGEGLLAKYMGKKKLIAETGAGQHGVAIATAAAYFGLECDVYMGEIDVEKQAPNVTRMRILGANVIAVKEGGRALKEAIDVAFKDYIKQFDTAIYCIGSVCGPHPFPMLVRDFQSVVGHEAREQFLEMTGNLPDLVTACVGGGSNAMGIFSGFLNDPTVELVGAEPGGRSLKLGENAATLTIGKEGLLHGMNTLVIQDEKGETAPVHSVASGLDYPGIGPEHVYLKENGRTKYETVSDDECINAFFTLSRVEGIIPALESSHALALAMRKAKELPYASILVNLSGRGDKDIDYVAEHYGFGKKDN
ncbi:tryptophan synthase subunit beta [bacterium]|nr:tryptophan synthase subunit beta [bacterium]